MRNDKKFVYLIGIFLLFVVSVYFARGGTLMTFEQANVGFQAPGRDGTIQSGETSGLVFEEPFNCLSPKTERILTNGDIQFWYYTQGNYLVMWEYTQGANWGTCANFKRTKICESNEILRIESTQSSMNIDSWSKYCEPASLCGNGICENYTVSYCKEGVLREEKCVVLGGVTKKTTYQNCKPTAITGQFPSCSSGTIIGMCYLDSTGAEILCGSNPPYRYHEVCAKCETVTPLPDKVEDAITVTLLEGSSTCPEDCGISDASPSSPGMSPEIGQEFGEIASSVEAEPNYLIFLLFAVILLLLAVIYRRK